MTCIITGSGSGIGRAVSINICKNGYYDFYALLGRNKEALIATKEAMLKENLKAKVKLYWVDLENSEELPGIVESIYADSGSIDCLMNIAGYTDPKPLLATSLESFERTYKINVFSPFLLMRECVKYMKKSGGKIMNVASTAGMSSRPGWVSYASSKAALIAIAQTLSEELAEYGIKVYCVSPGRCATNLRRILAPDEDPRTIMQPEDVAEVICRLISPSGECLDGQNIIIRKKVIGG